MPKKEAASRIKINKLLEAAGWRFFSESNNQANVRLELAVTLKRLLKNDSIEDLPKNVPPRWPYRDLWRDSGQK
jgi:hypothetical protein